MSKDSVHDEGKIEETKASKTAELRSVESRGATWNDRACQWSLCRGGVFAIAHDDDHGMHVTQRCF